jgi:Holliday junction resolvase-like predicted endonuclease
VAVESDLHEQIFSECRRRGWIAFHGAMSERTHRTLGEPDFVILAEGGRLLMVECKSRTGKLSLDQQAIAAHARKLGHTIYTVRSVEEFLTVINTGKL